jgi:hypothetical protein
VEIEIQIDDERIAAYGCQAGVHPYGPRVEATPWRGPALGRLPGAGPQRCIGGVTLAICPREC